LGRRPLSADLIEQASVIDSDTLEIHGTRIRLICWKSNRSQSEKSRTRKMEGRPPIPSEIRRRVMVEAGHRCAIPTCRHIEVEVHHIVPWEACKKHEYKNLIALCPNCHSRADTGKIDRKSLHLYKLNLRFAHDKYSQLEMDILFALGKKEGAISWPSFNMILLRRIVESGFLHVMPLPGGSTAVFGLPTQTMVLSLSEAGDAFISGLALNEL
jgi:hypothetical protein